jgi:hypothetical protein
MKAWNALIAALIVTGCASEQTLNSDTLVSRGGVALDAAQLRGLIVGAEIDGPTGLSNYGDVSVDESVGADGSLHGMASDSQGAISYSGKWSIDDSGRYCFERQFPRATSKGCEQWFKVGSDYFAASGKLAYRRKVARK